MDLISRHLRFAASQRRRAVIRRPAGEDVEAVVTSISIREQGSAQTGGTVFGPDKLVGEAHRPVGYIEFLPRR